MITFLNWITGHCTNLTRESHAFCVKFLRITNSAVSVSCFFRGFRRVTALVLAMLDVSGTLLG